MSTTTTHEKLWTTAEAAEFLNTTVGTLAIWRTTGRYNIPFIKMGRKVLYRPSDLEAWLESRTHTNTHTHTTLA